jgi:hypothetical protein
LLSCRTTVAVALGHIGKPLRAGELLAPFARILLAIAYVRDRDKSRALAELEILRQKFPANPLFVTEIARLEKPH